MSQFKGLGSIACLIAVCAATSAQASVVQAFGYGSAVTRTDASADFELPDNATPEQITALGLDRFYFEDGMRFDRFATPDALNSFCGFGQNFVDICGQQYLPYGFTGDVFVNYKRTTGIQIVAEPGNMFLGLEFRTGLGPPTTDPSWFLGSYWRAFNSDLNQLVGEGILTHGPGEVLSFFGTNGVGFDALFITQDVNTIVIDRDSGAGAAIDSVRAQYLTAPIPTPAAALSLATALAGLGGLTLVRRRRDRPHG